MELRKEWFEPGPDGKSRFTKLYRKSMDSGLLVSEAISAAFRALLAGEDVGRTADAKDAEIARLTAQRDELRTQLEASELRAKLLEKSYDEQHAAMSEKEGRCMELQAERDTLRARIDAGRVMYGGMYGHEHDIEMWTFNHVDTDTMTALLIDARPIDQPDAAMVDERTGKADRREKNLFGAHGRPGKSDRRRVTPSTRADRGRHERELHLPVVHDSHERDDS